MEAPRVARRRSAFLTPVWVTLFGALAVLGLLASWYSRAQTTTVIVVRHAEKEIGTIEDPPLSPAGDERAQRLATLFGRSGVGQVGAIYSTPTRRTRATAEPLATRLGIAITTNDQKPAALARHIKRQHHGEVTLVVGHSNTVPAIVAALSKRKDIPPIADDEFGTIYIVSVPDLGRASLVRLHY